MKILVLGSGGREHAITWKLRESQQMEEICCAPGNAGIAQEAELRLVDLSNLKEVVELASQLKVDLTVVGPETPLVAGVVDEFERAGLAIIGPPKAAAQLEGSKIFAKQFMQRHSVPTAKFVAAEKFEEAINALDGFSIPVVIKADGLAAGKGAVVARTREQAEKTLDEFMREKTLGSAGERVVIEEYLKGEEISFTVLTDGRNILPLAPAQDHKTAFDNDRGPHTGGMGAYSDDSIVDDLLRERILSRIVTATLAGMTAEMIPYRGFLYVGLMLTEDGPKVLEYNVRLGDPEAQAIMMRLRSDLAELLLALMGGQLGAVEAHWTPNPSVCVVLASKGYPGKSEVDKVITGCEAAESLGGTKVFHAGTAVRNRQLISTGGRVLGVTSIAEDLPASIERAYTAVDKIYFEGMHFRRDIGAKGLRQRSRQLTGKRSNDQTRHYRAPGHYR